MQPMCIMVLKYHIDGQNAKPPICRMIQEKWGKTFYLHFVRYKYLVSIVNT